MKKWLSWIIVALGVAALIKNREKIIEFLFGRD